MTTKTRREQELEREVKTLRALLAGTHRPGQGESEELLRLAYDAADLGVWENDLRTGRVFFDERARAHYGFDTGDVTLADVIARVHPDDVERLRQEIAAATGPTGDGRYLTEYRVLQPDGTVRWLRVQVRVHFEGEGAARRSIKGVGTSQDITGRKQAEEILRESEERYRALFEQAYDAILMVNEADEIVDANRRACELFGYSRQQLLAMRVPDLQAPQVRGTAGSVIRNELARHGNASFETIDVRSDGTLILVEVSTTRITRPGGDLYISIVRDITGLKRAERALREMADNMAAAQRIAHFGSWEIPLTRELELVDPQFWSDECYRIFGVEPGSVEITRELFYSRVHPDDREPAQQALIKALQEGTVTTYEYRLVLPGGAIRYLQDQVQVVLDECTRQPVKLVGTVQDVTERKQAEAVRARLETQLRQAQKLESIGRLAGGVAHDFNNLLTVIQGHASLLLAGRSAGDPLLDDLEQIRLAAERAASLTRQLLTFGRRQVLAPAIIDLNSLVTNLDKLLRRLIGEDISLATLLRPDLRPILADPGQIEQVIMNLVVNARDAMPTGGRLTIETSNIDLDDRYTATHPEAFNGPGVLLEVTDTGWGMDEATMAQIFEPFFTTKEPGKGTGLGLATVYGIVKQSRGDITVSSEPGRGTSFKLYFPAGEPATEQVAPEPQPVARRGSETILLVEDEEMVRSLVGRVLQAEGYRLLEVRRGEEALALLEQHQGAINLLLTDVVMPGMSGRELAERFKTLRPQAKVLFMSGYADDAVVRHGVLMAEVEFLAKPFSPDQLVARVRQVLDK